MRRIVALFVCSVFPLLAQIDRATLTGVVLDQSRAAVAGAKITLHAEATGLNYAGLSNPAGVYTFSGLAVGQYTASIVAEGFEPLQIQSFTLEVGETRTLNATLKVGSVSSNVTVMEATPDLELTTSEVG